jgi:hypothetical protein
VVNRNRQPIDPSEIYPGCDCIAFIDVYGYTFGAKKGVAIGFQHVMKVADNDPFASSGRSAEDAFSTLELPPEKTQVPENPFGNQVEMPKAAPAKTQPVPTAVDPFGGM